MGQKLEALYNFAQQAGGVEARARLSVMTGISSIRAKSQPDTPEDIQKLRAAIKQITGKDAPNV